MRNLKNLVLFTILSTVCLAGYQFIPSGEEVELDYVVKYNLFGLDLARIARGSALIQYGVLDMDGQKQPCWRVLASIDSCEDEDARLANIYTVHNTIQTYLEPEKFGCIYIHKRVKQKVNYRGKKKERDYEETAVFKDGKIKIVRMDFVEKKKEEKEYEIPPGVVVKELFGLFAEAYANPETLTTLSYGKESQLYLYTKKGIEPTKFIPLRDTFWTKNLGWVKSILVKTTGDYSSLCSSKGALLIWFAQKDSYAKREHRAGVLHLRRGKHTFSNAPFYPVRICLGLSFGTARIDLISFPQN